MELESGIGDLSLSWSVELESGIGDLRILCGTFLLQSAVVFQEMVWKTNGDFGTTLDMRKQYFFLLAAVATSRPLLLIFEDDLEAVKNARMENLKSLAEKGLSSLQSVQGNR